MFSRIPPKKHGIHSNPGTGGRRTREAQKLGNVFCFINITLFTYSTKTNNNVGKKNQLERIIL